MQPTVVLLLPTTAYRADDFLAAAHRLSVRVVAVSDRCHVLAQEWTEGPLAIEFRDAEAAASQLVQALGEVKPAAIVGVDDQTAVIAAITAARLGMPHNPPAAVRAARNKAESRERLRKGGVATPWFELVPRDVTGPALEALLSRAPYPCVVKPLILSGSRGVMRADDPAGLRTALARLGRLLQSAQVADRRDPELARVMIEEFIPGAEVALEGLLTGGQLHVLALFDKPDPLDGPFFEETLYVTPSRHPISLQREIAAAVSAGAAALGLREGPVHAELRLSPAGPRILEVAARSIGGLCGRALRFGVGMTLEELLLRHALGETAIPVRDVAAAGVLMLPIRRGGMLEEVRGVEAAKKVPLIEDVVVTAHVHEELVALPEGASYLGFVFARGETPEAVEAALRRAGALIEPVVRLKLSIAQAGTQPG